jgi:hypothetical protein
MVSWPARATDACARTGALPTREAWANAALDAGLSEPLTQGGVEVSAARFSFAGA